VPGSFFTFSRFLAQVRLRASTRSFVVQLSFASRHRSLLQFFNPEDNARKALLFNSGSNEEFDKAYGTRTLKPSAVLAMIRSAFGTKQTQSLITRSAFDPKRRLLEQSIGVMRLANETPFIIAI
jgi:hypothetical protein